MNKVLPTDVFNYLEKKSYRDWQLEWDSVSGIEAAIVVPAICEFENLKTLIQSLSKNDTDSLKKTLLIFVINNSVTSDIDVKLNNQNAIKFLRQLNTGDSSNHLQSEIIKSGLRIGLIDACSEGCEFNEKLSGVGFARKVGMDLALTTFDYSIPGKKIIISLDADCIVDTNYISEIINYFTVNSTSVANIEFEHNFSESKINISGIIAYEIFLRHYVTGLLFAKSPFAFHTVGSTLICDHKAYITAGGMNTKKAAEDFYFQQKLAKHFRIERILTTRVRPSARESWRVPFGTGRTMMEISSGEKNIQVYDPEIYLILKNWLELFYSDLSLNIESLISETKKIHPELFNFLTNRNFIRDWTNILENSKSTKQLNYQRKNLFDAFETLKLAHYLRDKAFPMMEISPGVKKLFRILEHNYKLDLENGNIISDKYLGKLLTEIRSVEFSLYENLNQ